MDKPIVDSTPTNINPSFISNDPPPAPSMVTAKTAAKPTTSQPPVSRATLTPTGLTNAKPAINPMDTKPISQPITPIPPAVTKNANPQPTPIPTPAYNSPYSTPSLSKPTLVSSGNVTINSRSNEDKKSSIVLSILGILALGIMGAVGYLYYSNYTMKKAADTSPEPQEVVTEFNPQEIQIVNGNVYHAKPLGEGKVLVDKEQYPESGIIGFTRVVVSPKNTLICFESLPPAPGPALYIAKVDGTDVKEVVKGGRNCQWHADGQILIYSATPDESTLSQIYAYDTASGQTTSLTQGIAPEGVERTYEFIGVSEDGTKALCSYKDLNTADSNEEYKNCEIPIVTRSTK